MFEVDFQVINCYNLYCVYSDFYIDKSFLFVFKNMIIVVILWFNGYI